MQLGWYNSFPLQMNKYNMLCYVPHKGKIGAGLTVVYSACFTGN